MTLVKFGIVCLLVAFVAPVLFDLPANVPVIMAVIGAGSIVVGLVISLSERSRE